MSELLGIDHEFEKLVSRREDVDLTIAALEIARDLEPGLDFSHTLDWIRDRGRQLLREVARFTDAADVVEELVKCLAGEHGLGGDLDCYRTADSSFLNRVVETKRGIPISLSLVYIAVAKEIGLELHGVSSPAHFLTRAETDTGPVFIDCFSGGRILSEPEAHGFVASLINDDPDQFRHAFEPAGPRTIIIRILHNLKSLFAEQEKWASAWHIQNRLSRLQPSSYRERRDLAVISLRANRPGAAVNLLNSLLKTCPDTDREFLHQSLRDAERQMACWN
jgi:regulator of sirC expression with transglutaminase-like and TPR domain